MSSLPFAKQKKRVVNKSIHEVTQGFLIGGIEFLESSKTMKHSYKVTSQVAEIFKIRVDNFVLLLKNQDLLESFNEKKQTIRVISNLLRLNQSVNRKFLNFTNFDSYFQPKIIKKSKNVFLDFKKHRHLGDCDCENCFKENCQKQRQNIENMVPFDSRLLNVEVAKGNNQGNGPTKFQINASRNKRFESQKPQTLKYLVEMTQNTVQKEIHNASPRKSFFLQKKKNPNCIYSNFQARIYDKIKSKSRGFSQLRVPKMKRVLAKNNDYFHSFNGKSTLDSKKMQKSSKRVKTGYKQKNSRPMSVTNVTKSEQSSVRSKSSKQSRIRLLSTRAMRKRRKINSGAKGFVLIHKKIAL